MNSRKISKSLRVWQVLMLAGVFAFLHVATHPTLLPPIYFDNPNKAAFFFGQPLEVLRRISTWVSSGSIYAHLSVTLIETALAFVGAVVGEYLGSSEGVGYLILQAEGTFDINSVFAGILVLTAFALALDWMVTAVEQRLMVWQPRSGETERI